ncbi:flavodoxin family protein [Butyrivibrio sp. XPD2006]|uniref:flavodoxin family protein n=1 Tax=Butyrivibrio sp. XPD2006 TaxID=1280668 RepID=UPI0003B762FD|nr:flavodoxin family protein [Butyrivibrio sp. XPD2006]
MNLLIHDLDEKEWEEIAEDYRGWEVIAPSKEIKPCVGCFGCWLKTPGQCVIKDGYDRMGALIHQADELVVMSKYTYGGFSSFVKNVFDRSIGWVLPYFTIVDNEMHHRKRYPEDKKITVIFRGNDLTKEDQADAKRYVEAVCRNFYGVIKDIRFDELKTEVAKDISIEEIEREEANVVAFNKTILLNASLRGENSNTGKFLEKLEGSIGEDVEIINLSAYINRPDELVKALLPVKRIVLGMPMYVDGIPSALLKIMEMLEKTHSAEDKKIYAVVNMGFYESRQIRNALKQVRKWSEKCGFSYCGGLAIGAGEMMGSLIKSINGANGPVKNVVEAIETLAGVIKSSSAIDDIYADAYKFPRSAYMFMAGMGWPKAAKQNGLKKKDLLKRIEE